MPPQSKEPNEPITYLGHFERVRALSGGASGTTRLLVVGGVRAGAASQVHIFDVAAGKPLHTLSIPDHALATALCGEALAVACSDGALRMYNAASGAALRSLSLGAAVNAVAAGKEHFYTAGSDGVLRAFKLDGGAAGEWPLSSQPLRAVAVGASNDPEAPGEILAAAGDEGVVYTLTPPQKKGAAREQRALSGHEGAVRALCFTSDGRLASAGDDAALRLWYLVGTVDDSGAVKFDCEVRGGDDSGHTGPVLALLCPPPAPQGEEGDREDDESARERLISAGSDGKVKLWRLADKRRPKTLVVGSKAIHALLFLPPASPAEKRKISGSLLCAGDSRTVQRYALDLTGQPQAGDKPAHSYEHGFVRPAADLQKADKNAAPAREAAIKLLADPAVIDEPEALELLLGVLTSEREPELRALAAKLLGEQHREAARARLRERLDDDTSVVRRAALAALKTLAGDDVLAPLRAALESRYADMRVAALKGLVAVRSPLTPGLIAGRLADSEAIVRRAALDRLQALDPSPAGQVTALRTGYERGPADLKIEVLRRAALAGLLEPGVGAELLALLSRALDDGAAEVRRAAFTLTVMLRPALLAALEPRDEDLARAVRDFLRGVVQRQRQTGDTVEDEKPGSGEPSDGEMLRARETLLEVLRRGGRPAAGPLTEDDLLPLLQAMACRTPDTALGGARGLAALGDVRALGALLQLSRETDPALRRATAAALRQLQDPRARRRLLWMLDDADAGVRGAALDAYSNLIASSGDAPPEPGAVALAGAEAALRSAFEDIRVRGLEKIVKLEGAQRAAGEDLLSEAIEDEAAKVRGEAFRTLWAWHEREPQPLLERTLQARFTDVRLRAVAELAVHGARPNDNDGGWARDKLLQTIADRDAQVAQAAYDEAVKVMDKVQGVDSAQRSGAPSIDEDAQGEARKPTRGMQRWPQPRLAAMASPHPSVRAAGARGAARCAAEAVRDALVKQLADEDLAARTAALETLDWLLPADGALISGALQGAHLDLRVRVAELLAGRHDTRAESIIDPLRALITDKDLELRIAAPVLRALRIRAAAALATLGSPRTVKFLATELLKHDLSEIREQAARGLANAARSGDEGYLLDALGHADVWVRSWAADGLSRLGDARALPVLTGNLRHDHLPIRQGAILSFAALGPEGYGGMLQGLEDPTRQVQEIVFAIILSRDLQARRRGAAPDLLTSALSAQRPELRYAAARALELRGDDAAYVAQVIEVLLPPRPDKVADMKDWPAEASRGPLMLGLAESLAGESPMVRYAAAQVLTLKGKPLEFFREAQRIVRPRAEGAALVPDTTPRPGYDADEVKPRRGWLRRLFSGGAQQPAEETADARPGGKVLAFGRKDSPEAALPALQADPAHFRRLAFGAYVGLLRQQGQSDDEADRVRRDAVERIVDLGLREIGKAAALPAVVRALDDGNHLVRRGALAGLKRLLGDVDEALTVALRAQAADVARAALDELAARAAQDPAARGRIQAALSSPVAEVRRAAFELLEKLAGKGSLEPLLLALTSDHADLRIGVIERLATQSDPRVAAALRRAMESDHDDLRLRAAELLADRKEDAAADVLAGFLRSEEGNAARRAQEALVRIGSPAALRALAAREHELWTMLTPGVTPDAGREGARVGLLAALGKAAAFSPKAVALKLAAPSAATLEATALLTAVLARAEDTAAVREAALRAALQVVGPAPSLGPAEEASLDPLAPERWQEWDRRRWRHEEPALQVLGASARSRDAATRLRAARELRWGHLNQADALLLPLCADRDAAVRAAAVAAYRDRVLRRGAPVAALLPVLRDGQRGLILASAEAVARSGDAAALRPLLLVSRAGEGGERERALLALGSLGDARALAELEKIATGGLDGDESSVVQDDPAAAAAMRASALEALGRLLGASQKPDSAQRSGAPSLDADAQKRLLELLEDTLTSDGPEALQRAALRGMLFYGLGAGPAARERARSRLETLLLSDDSAHSLRSQAAEALGLLGDREAERALALAMKDRRHAVRHAARRALGVLFPAEADKTRVSMLALDSGQSDLASDAAAYLARRGDPAELLPRLATLDDDDLREQLRYGLLRRPQLPFAPIVALLGHKEASARAEAAWLLGARAAEGGDAAIPAADQPMLATALAAAVARAQVRLGEATLEAKDREAEQRALLQALWALGAGLSPQTAVPSLAAVVKAGEALPAASRLQAVRSLQRIGGGAVAKALLPALSDTDADVRRAAGAALSALAPKQAATLAATALDPVAVAALLPGALQQAAPASLLKEEPARRLALPLLLRRHADQDLRALREAADNKTGDAAARLDAIAALGRSGGAEAIALLRGLAADKKSGDVALRKAAYRAFRRAQRLATRNKKHEARA